MLTTQLLSEPTANEKKHLATLVSEVFGRATDSMESVAERARQLLPEQKVIVWEGDASTFQFMYVGGDAESVLGYPSRDWIEKPTFWADTVVHPEDRDEAIAFCALATGKCEDHDFVYRARAASGDTRVLHDVVTVIRGERGVAERLRGLMLDVTESSPRD